MALSGVRCTVDSCQFWTAPNHCDAPKIEVDINHTGLGGEAGAGRGAGARAAGMEIGEVGVYRRGAVEREGAYEMGDLDIGGAARGVEPAGRPTARKSEHTCCRTFRPHS
ncbi:MAG: DUF1540 domain-containing protein [Bacillota bacterium]|nr:DUF1540 domain-containing protein [Bacillota bacterium]